MLYLATMSKNIIQEDTLYVFSRIEWLEIFLEKKSRTFRTNISDIVYVDLFKRLYLYFYTTWSTLFDLKPLYQR